jgi:1-deoxy-D-xylulose-5-phosphate reductoisomerase
MHNPRKIAILGSTGSIGRQALEVIRSHPDLLCAEILTAQDNVKLLAEQAAAFGPDAVVIGNEKHYTWLREALSDKPIKVFAGSKALTEIMSFESFDMVLTAMVGIAGLSPTLAAIENAKSVALANKETLVVAGHLITRLAREKAVNIYPVDSEHSAIFQCLAGEFHNPVEKIYLTASGGPFRGMKKEELLRVRKDAALNHPNWDMGSKITIDSATLMNKGLEVIEAKWLFGLQPEQIDVIVHPQSIIHSIVQFRDGSMKAQMGLPDMKLPIQYALTYPRRAQNAYPRFNFADYPVLDFEAPDTEIFQCLPLAYEAMKKGGNTACVLNAANEIAVSAFLCERIGFLNIPAIIQACMQQIPFIDDPDIDDIIQTNHATRLLATDMLKDK